MKAEDKKMKKQESLIPGRQVDGGGEPSLSAAQVPTETSSEFIFQLDDQSFIQEIFPEQPSCVGLRGLQHSIHEIVVLTLLHHQ